MNLLGTSVVMVGALIVGAAVGQASHPPSPNKPEPVTKWRTKYTEATPSPVTITADFPQSCKDALSLSVAISKNAAALADSATPMMDALKDASVAVAQRDKLKMNAAAQKINTLNSGTLTAKRDYADLLPKFSAASKQCSEEQ